MAHWLQERACSVRLYEQAGVPGGCMRSERVDGYLFEHGPTSLMTNSPDVYRLCERVGLSSSWVDANASAKRRYLAKGGRLVALPQGPVDFVRSPA
jgi:protoporphyrinogen/coproporphyrinogen III oxidase